jgi:SAM-dependent methyltransferase
VTGEPGLGHAFDAYAEGYDEALHRGVALSGERAGYFARGRLAWLRQRLDRLDERPQSVLDFGCGTGGTAPILIEVLGVSTVMGVDSSPRSLEVAQRAHGTPAVRFVRFDQYQPDGRLDLAFCNGVFHHIPPVARGAAVDYVRRALRPGGLFAFWENNPWNPGARLVMHRIPFDRDADPLAPTEARRLLRAGGFEVLRTDFLFIFPRALRWLRRLEPPLARLPLGAQYEVLCRRPR